MYSLNYSFHKICKNFVLYKMKFGQLKDKFVNSMKPKINGLILFGVPGAGKGTYGSLIMKDWNLLKLTPGDLIRRVMKNNENTSEKYEKLKYCMKNGLLVEDEIVLDLVEEEYKKQIKNYSGVIFDGIPRNIKQAEELGKRFELEKYLLVDIILREDILLEKLLGRRVCVNCGENYNICSIHKEGYEMEPLLPQKEDTCDKCHSQLTKRDDDKEDIIKRRIDIYQNETKPVLDILKNKGVKSIVFEPKKGIKDYPLLKDELLKYNFV